ncbi:Interactor of constitutive active ROPs 3 [Dendrobium catenatum]|uniref:Interactor of constitutive active ROPs 3 n=1 Tax=Dendrobium catenatum TaxID=906689 RepID=A0A2I0W849_9ASPA|nr:Interactor of constitutive active ROPs 3 [Dendrobium catenatum]
MIAHYRKIVNYRRPNNGGSKFSGDFFEIFRQFSCVSQIAGMNHGGKKFRYQWRKAAEAASTILTSGNDGRNHEDPDKNSISVKLTGSATPFSDDFDGESLKKNNNVLRKIGGLWKKSPKLTFLSFAILLF